MNKHMADASPMETPIYQAWEECHGYWGGAILNCVFFCLYFVHTSCSLHEGDSSYMRFVLVQYFTQIHFYLFQWYIQTFSEKTIINCYKIKDFNR